MPVYQTQGIILKKKNFSEADRLLTILTLKKGKIVVIAKGTRRPISRKGGSLDIFNWCDLQIAAGANLDIVTEVQLIRSFQKIKSDLNKTSLAFTLCEMLDGLIAPNQPQALIFKDTLKAYMLLSNSKNIKNARLVLVYSQLKILESLGYFSIEAIKNGQVYQLINKLLKFQNFKDDNLFNNLEVTNLEHYVNGQIEQVLERKLQSRELQGHINNINFLN
jgi:predicted transcriptional regulator